MNKIILNSILKSVEKIIQNTTNEKKISELKNKHREKVHFIPIRYRVLNGMLQSMNIQFGNFLEETISSIVEEKENYIILENYSGKKDKKFSCSKKSIAEIDGYINACQNNNYNDETLEKEYNTLLEKLVNYENNAIEEDLERGIKQDIDLIFQDKITKQIIYTEIKYNDDHDTGKFIDINRKVLKTLALLIHEFKITDVKNIKLVLMYFNNKRMKGNIYLPEEKVIYRGEKFFEAFTNVNYNEIDSCFKQISESEEINKKFDELCSKVTGIKNQCKIIYQFDETDPSLIASQ